ncbi:PREDICTED: 39S ribosomal protein L12, mitochondrial [Dufourea novaeangliae]|uniref:39S ribosomal protein L12, mitochondrial n=1 Tax=Dufourea novaeangliae TaxID=178035 RepID=A0A154P8J5_DUFNO|nr:PREDICTED: 39S ribosomal protein L12, mitochondrial [Dufourea novaeangliae]KZC08256.1 39S ribosomal protein L12, mitochondrial [Dufourea novaeangliae]
MNSLRFMTRRNIHQIRQFHKCIVQQTEAAAVTARVEPLVSPPVDTTKQPPVSSKIEQIADQIVTLNLIEVAQLSDLLKKRLNLPDAPMMPMGGFAVAPAAVEEDEEPQIVQTAFTVKLTAFDEKQKIPLIKELKNILPDCNLVQAKKFVEALPGIVTKDITKEEAEKLKDTITKVGGTVEIV